MTPILMIGAGRMGGALIEGWRRAGAFSAPELIIRDPQAGEAARAAAEAGARLNPPDEALAEARTVILAVKPQAWREAAAPLAPLIAPDARIVSIMAGVGTADIAAAFTGRPVARAMPTTAAAIGKCTATVFAADPAAGAAARHLFEPVGAVVDVADEDLMHAATAVSGSSPAYLYAFVEALEAAGAAEGLEPEASRTLARATIAGAAALMAESGQDPAVLRAQVTSPGGTTAAALGVLQGEDGLPDLLARAVAAAAKRSRELSG